MKAFSAGCAASMRSRQALRELDARKFFALAGLLRARQRRLVHAQCSLLDDLRHEIQAGFNLRRVAW